MNRCKDVKYFRQQRERQNLYNAKKHIFLPFSGAKLRDVLGVRTPLPSIFSPTKNSVDLLIFVGNFNIQVPKNKIKIHKND